MMGKIIKKTAEETADRDCIGAAKLVVFCNAPEDNPFMAGAFHGVGEPDCIINVGVSGPGVVRAALEKEKDANITQIADTIKKLPLKLPVWECWLVPKLLNVWGFHLVLLTFHWHQRLKWAILLHIFWKKSDWKMWNTRYNRYFGNVKRRSKKGGVMASSQVGGLSGAFIPVSEDAGMIDAARCGALSIEKLEAMTAVCSVGLDMIVVPGDTPDDTLSAIIADEAAIGMVNFKTTAVRLIPAIGKRQEKN